MQKAFETITLLVADLQINKAVYELYGLNSNKDCGRNILVGMYNYLSLQKQKLFHIKSFP